MWFHDFTAYASAGPGAARQYLDRWPQWQQSIRIQQAKDLRDAVEQLRKLGSNASGASALEFAICCPLFMMLLVGIMSYGLYFGTSHSVSQLAADAARASIAGLSMSERQAIAQTHVSQNIGRYPLLSLTRTTVATVAANSGSGFEVDVTYDASNLPLYFAFITTPNPTIRRAAVITNGGN